MANPSKPSAVPVFPPGLSSPRLKPSPLPVIPAELFDALSRPSAPPSGPPVIPSELFDALARTRPTSPPNIASSSLAATSDPSSTNRTSVRSKLFGKLVSSVSNPSPAAPEQNQAAILNTHSHAPRNKSLGGFLPDLAIAPISLDLESTSRPLSISNSPENASKAVPSPQFPTIDSPPLEEHHSSRSSFILLATPASALQTPTEPTTNDLSVTPKAKETLWNKIGFSSASFSSSAAGTTKKLLLKHQHPSCESPNPVKSADLNSNLDSSNAQLPPTSGTSSTTTLTSSPCPTTSSINTARPRTSFSLDHYIQTHLHNDKKAMSSSAQRRMASHSKDSLSPPKTSASNNDRSATNILSKRRSLRVVEQVDSAGSSAAVLVHSLSEISPTKNMNTTTATPLPSPSPTTTPTTAYVDNSTSKGRLLTDLTLMGSSKVVAPLRSDPTWPLPPLTNLSNREPQDDGGVEEEQDNTTDDVPWPNRETFTHDLQQPARGRLAKFLGPEEDEEEDLDDQEEEIRHIRQHIPSTRSADSPHRSSTKANAQIHARPSALPFRLLKDGQPTFFTFAARDSLDARRQATSHTLAIRSRHHPYHPNASQVSSFDSTGSGSKFTNPVNLDAAFLDAPHTAPSDSRFPRFEKKYADGCHRPGMMPINGRGNADGKQGRARSISDSQHRPSTSASANGYSGASGNSFVTTQKGSQRGKGGTNIALNPSAQDESLGTRAGVTPVRLTSPGVELIKKKRDDDSLEGVKEGIVLGGPDDKYYIDSQDYRNALGFKADFTIGVAGPKGVGKSTIINRALRKPISNPVLLYQDDQMNKITSYSSSGVSTGTGGLRTVQVLEVDQAVLEDRFVKKDNKEGFVWPKRLPSLDGILLCYDAMDPTALDHLRPLLHSFWTRGGISLIVLACKSNKNEALNATSPLKAAELVNVYGTGMIQLDGGLEDPGKKMRNSFNWIMKAIREARGEARSYSSASTHILGSSISDEPHSPSSTSPPRNYLHLDVVHESSGSLLPDATIDLLTESTSAAATAEEAAKTPAALTSSNPDRAKDAKVARERQLTITVDSAKDYNRDSQQPSMSSSHSPLPSHPTEAVDPPSDAGLSPNQDFPTSASSRHAAQKAIVMSQRGSEVDTHFEKQTLIEKFIFATVSGNEPRFVDQFLIVFRRFATPFDVLSALITRFEFVSYHLEDDPLLTRYAHMKICHVLMTWVETYPGDFVRPTTLSVLKAFNQLILSATWLLHYAVELLPMSKSIAQMVDEDAGWALPDTTDDATVEELLSHLTGLKATFAPAVPRVGLGLDNEQSTMEGPSLHTKLEQEPNPKSQDPLANCEGRTHQARLPAKLRDSQNDTQSSLGLKSTTSSSLQADAKAESKSLLEYSNQLLALPDEVLALQITRLEWEIFSEMKPRHLIRYVLAPRDPKNPRVALRDPNSPIARSTDYLNHLAAWASSMILIQEKLKSRARVLLKLMKVAYELRDMDDFHSLMGVLAGIESQPVYRLEATFDVVQHTDFQAYRRYLSLKRLMSSQRSFSAYRLARQTASVQSVPYLGTYLQDITAVCEVKDDMKDGKVNWTKFGQIAKATATVHECAKLAPEIELDERVEGLIMRVPILSEDAQYELSYKWKPRPGNHRGTGTLGPNGSRRSGPKQTGVVSTPGSGSGVAKKGTRKLRQLINTAMQ